jgi:hypothetical protein
MKAILQLFLFIMICSCLQAQNIIIFGTKYEKTYQSLELGRSLFDGYSDWTLMERRIRLGFPFPFLDNRFLTRGLSLTGANILTENNDYFLSTVPISAENSSNLLWGLASRPAGDTSEIGRITLLETDSIFSMEYKDVALKLYNVENDSFWYPDLRFNYQYHINCREDRVRIHFGKTEIGPEGAGQLESLLLFSAIAFRIWSDGRTYMYTDGDPDSPGFELIYEEQPSYGEYTLDSIPDEGTVFEYSFATTTSNAPQISGQKVKIFPTPGRNYFRLDYGSVPFSYSVWDLSGQRVTSGTSQAEESVRVETHDWPAGVYIISIGNEEQSARQSWIKIQ